jgi:hypothetical protein
MNVYEVANWETTTVLDKAAPPLITDTRAEIATQFI